jgi:DNA helicase-2/ATP-dependent DNA helicase PcrA
MTVSKQFTTSIEDVETIFKKLNFHPTEDQLKAITAIEGPQIIIAGPGSGKTEVLVLRFLYLHLVKKIPVSKILVSTFTEKAAASLKDRIRQAILELGSDVDLTELWIGTTHSICSDIIDEEINHTWLKKGYTVLDDLTQKLFLFENFYPIIGNNDVLGNGKWPQIRNGIDYFNKITEDRIDPEEMKNKGTDRLRSIARKYERYEENLKSKNSVDFAHLQSIVLELLDDNDIGSRLRKKFDYIMVDEYQDTNYIQELIYLRLSAWNNNICVVGDDDQSLYRFRGAVVENFLNFPTNFKDINKVKLEDNFRSTPEIVRFVNGFMKSHQWKDKAGRSFRYDKEIKETRPPFKNGMKSIYRISSDPGGKIAELIKKMKEQGIIDDYNQVAILLRSVAYDAQNIIEALDREGIKYYATHAKRFFDLVEIKMLIGVLLNLPDFEVKEENWNRPVVRYYDRCRETLESFAGPELKKFIIKTQKNFENLKDSMKMGIVDLFYQSLAYPPLSSWIEDPIKGRNIAIFSTILTEFQEYYHLQVITVKNQLPTSRYLFNSFFYALYQMKLDEYEDPFDVFPQGYVQLMTIHQAKGLEFPVVIVSSLGKGPKANIEMDQELEPFKKRKHTEPWDSVASFDHHRLYYVAFSRAMDLLLLADDKDPHPELGESLNHVPELSSEEEKLIMELKFRHKEFLPPKPEFSITSHIHAYEVCPKQYKYYKEYEFTGSRSSGQAFGLLVHYTIEDIHRHYLETKDSQLSNDEIELYFNKNYRSISRGGAHPLGQVFLDMALKQVLAYYQNNKEKFSKIVKTEEPIQVEREKYVMSGIIDLIRGDKGQLELLDFKAEKDEDVTKDAQSFYEFQLSIYAKMIEKKIGEKPAKAYIYLTGEEDSSKTLREVQIGKVQTDVAESKFDNIAEKIIRKDFSVHKAPPRDVCRNCDFRHGCAESKRFYPSI